MLPELPDVFVDVTFSVIWMHLMFDCAPVTDVPKMRMMLSPFGVPTFAPGP